MQRLSRADDFAFTCFVRDNGRIVAGLDDADAPEPAAQLADLLILSRMIQDLKHQEPS